mmetsp:Transcript_25320/g.58838  ORF Transcript_25320/g.58838 Transcript_25320/m.58838 type:complete len:435 (+) Transcript_25320:84-1388(+)
MDECQLRSLRLPELAALWLDCISKKGTRSFHAPSSQLGAGVPAGSTKEELIADILSWQMGASTGCRSAKISSVRCLPTPARGRQRRSRGELQTCQACGWAVKASVVCACPFQQLNPMRPVTRILTISALAPYSQWHPSSGSASVTLPAVSQLKEGETIELRMLRKLELEHHVWPEEITVLIDDEEVAGIDVAKRRQQEVPWDLTSHLPSGRSCRLRIEASEGAVGDISRYMFCIAVTASQLTSDLKQECLNRGQRCSEADAKKLLMSLSKVTTGPEGAEAVEDCRAAWMQPLNCPLSLSRIRLPVRGRNCQHLRCFDLEAFLSISAATTIKQRWRCPLCSCRLLPADLLICSLTQRLLQEAAPGISEVEVPLIFSGGQSETGQEDAAQVKQPAVKRLAARGGFASDEKQSHPTTAPWGKRLRRSFAGVELVLDG